MFCSKRKCSHILSGRLDLVTQMLQILETVLCSNCGLTMHDTSYCILVWDEFLLWKILLHSFQLMKQMSSTDTPLGTLSLLQHKQKETQSAYVVLSGSKQMWVFLFSPFICSNNNRSEQKELCCLLFCGMWYHVVQLVSTNVWRNVLTLIFMVRETQRMAATWFS